MLSSQVCDRLTDEENPRISIDALTGLRRLIDAQCRNSSSDVRSCAESSSGGQDAQQRKSRRVAAPAALRGRTNLDEASRTGAGTLPDLVGPGPGKRRQKR